jgi:hypothetical protein
MSDTEPTTDDEEPEIHKPDEVDGGVSLPGIPDALLSRLPDDVRNLMSIMQQDDGIAKMLLRPVYAPGGGAEPTVSQAQVVADMFNILRLDTKAIGEAAGVDIEAKRMTPEKAAAMLQELVEGESLELTDHFDAIEESREKILLELTDEETVEEHREVKQQVSYVQQARWDQESEEDA